MDWCVVLRQSSSCWRGDGAYDDTDADDLGLTTTVLGEKDRTKTNTPPPKKHPQEQHSVAAAASQIMFQFRHVMAGGWIGIFFCAGVQANSIDFKKVKVGHLLASRNKLYSRGNTYSTVQNSTSTVRKYGTCTVQ